MNDQRTMAPVILFRAGGDEESQAELKVAQNSGLLVAQSRVELRDHLVIGRYSVLPYYKELEQDLLLQGSKLVNSHREHEYIANFHWYKDIEGLTPRTWFDLVTLPKDDGPFVVKGLTNSRKFEWDTMMYAKTYADVLRITTALGQDGLIGSQGFVVREHVPLRVLETGLHGLPFANEWRFFFWGEVEIARGFYWTATEKRAPITETGIRVAGLAAKEIAKHAKFFVVDVAETADGRWIVIEVNDGQMSGLSDVHPVDLYNNLSTHAYRDQDRRDGESRTAQIKRLTRKTI
jgi:hypothetical protein